MTTDITELAQREKFEAWAEERCALPLGYLKNRAGEGTDHQRSSREAGPLQRPLSQRAELSRSGGAVWRDNSRPAAAG